MSKENGGFVKAWEATVRKSQAAKKKANSIFSTMSVAHADDDDDNDSSCSLSEGSEVSHALANGDFYTGQWADNLPHGNGKYLWTDGCMYVGEWFKGKTMGKGRFSWPSGATYEGDFKSGYMDGKGTYTGCLGDTYKGSWIMNLKHGNGIKRYANGDYYEGEWRRGLQDGQGRYQWRNDNHYIGNWTNGMINGNGTMIWANGNRYDGSWEDGLPKGNGTFRWEDGSFYVGVWSKDPSDQSGTYYPPADSPADNVDWDPQEVFAVDLSDCKICPSEKVLIFPSQKMLNWPGVEGETVPKQRPSRASRNSVDRRMSNFSRESDSEFVSDNVDSVLGYGEEGMEDEFGSRALSPKKVTIQPVKRQGNAISKGHKNYDLMLNLQLGIRSNNSHTELISGTPCRHSVGRPAPATSLDLKNSAFDPKEKVWTKFPTEGSKHTPPHQSCEFKWKDYCPVVFRTLRKLFQVDAADYMLSICGNDALRELSSPGKSGSFFYLTTDDKYMIKTMKKSEVKVLLRMLPAYYNHVRAFENTLVTKFFGLHCVKLTGPAQKKVRFVIMGNLFCSEYSIHRRFDLKGSSHGRTTDKSEAEIDPTTTLKDLDLNFIFRLQKIWFQDFCKQVDRDCDFLEQERIMDYSMLVGLHFRETSCNKETQVTEACPSASRTPMGSRTPLGSLTPSGARTPGSRTPTGSRTPIGSRTPTGSRTPISSRTPTGSQTPTGNGDFDNEGEGIRLSSAYMDHFLDPARWASIRLGVNMPARVEQTVRSSDYDFQLVGEPTGEFYEVILFFSIIDILQDYDISKKLEHAYKSIQYDPTSISAVDPRLYSKRFRDFIFKVFTEDT